MMSLASDCRTSMLICHPERSEGSGSLGAETASPEIVVIAQRPRSLAIARDDPQSLGMTWCFRIAPCCSSVKLRGCFFAVAIMQRDHAKPRGAHDDRTNPRSTSRTQNHSRSRPKTRKPRRDAGQRSSSCRRISRRRDSRRQPAAELIFLGGAVAAVDDAVREDANVGVLVARDLDAAAHTLEEYIPKIERARSPRARDHRGGRRCPSPNYAWVLFTWPDHAPQCPTILLNMIAHMRWADTLVADALCVSGVKRGTLCACFAHMPPRGDCGIHESRARRSRTPCGRTCHRTRRGPSRRDTRICSRTRGRGRRDAPAPGRSYRNSAGRDFRNTVEEIVTHVTMHGSYHRGQIARIVRASGGDPPYTDYIQFSGWTNSRDHPIGHGSCFSRRVNGGRSCPGSLARCESSRSSLVRSRRTLALTMSSRRDERCHP